MYVLISHRPSLTLFDSVIGIISIPGTMTGAILGGSSVEQAARLQMVMMFMIMASMTLSAIVSTILVLSIVMDADHRTRSDRIETQLHIVWRVRRWLFDATFGRLQRLWIRLVSAIQKRGAHEESLVGEREQQPLLG